MDIPLPEQNRLIAACKKNETWAMKRLYELYAPTMLGLCVRYMSNTENAKDVMQEGFMTVFSKIDTFNASGSFEGWMRRIFVTTALKAIRKMQLFAWVDVDEYGDSIPDSDYSGLEKLSADEIAGCIAELSTNLRIVFNMYVIEGYSHAEIAQILNIKESSSRSSFTRARQILQTKLQKLYKRVE
ncbi:sigma-70 family RNA polymerase sigma factor [Bacteroidales bacterium OttesenSCG-928-A17]|nr:sigma-70 family RNA polymerase sigma factor [Bacteroidales bacterium OttesenSCG-928-A17]